MINNISFKGNVYSTGCIKHSIKPYEKKFFNRFSKQFDCDVVLLNRDSYNEGMGLYDTIIVQPDKISGCNIVDYRKFDFSRPLF